MKTILLTLPPSFTALNAADAPEPVARPSTPFGLALITDDPELLPFHESAFPTQRTLN
jgi:hypothetical protein